MHRQINTTRHFHTTYCVFIRLTDCQQMLGCTFACLTDHESHLLSEVPAFSETESVKLMLYIAQLYFNEAKHQRKWLITIYSD